MILKSTILLLLCFSACGKAAKVLLAPFAVYSQINQLTTIGEELVNFGHEVHCLIPGYKSLPKSAEAKGIKPIYYGPGKNEKPFMFDSEEFTRDMFEKNLNGSMSVIFDIKNLAHILQEMGEALLSDDVFKKLEAEKFDFAMTTGVQIFRFPVIIPHRLKIPFASVTVELPTDLFSTLMRMPSIDPSIESVTAQGTKMTFLGRVKNVFSYLAFTYAFPAISGFDESFGKFSGPVKFGSFREISAKSSIWIVDRSSLLGLPLPSAPNVFYVDCVSAVLPKPLPSDLQKVADSATGGLVIVSFGSTIAYLHHRHLDKLALAFKKMPKFTFILRTKTTLTVPIPPNLKIMSWMPQNDLLGHKNTVLFITHCGNAGTHEAMANGVPMLGLPIQGDQRANAAMFSSRGYGKILKLNEITVDDVVDTVREITSNSTYKENIKRASVIMRSDLIRPNRKAAAIVDHVIKFGDKHLKSGSINYSWYEILMFDIFLAFEVVLLIIAFVAYRICKRCFRKETKKWKRD